MPYASFSCSLTGVDLKNAQAKLRYLSSGAEKQQKRQSEKKKLMMQSAERHESNAAKLCKSIHSSPDRPLLEDTYPDLNKAIDELVTAGAGADMRHGTDALNSCKTLYDPCAGLLEKGYGLFRQALYLQ